jgi:N-sulfoglucosamine sulfohydrolase
MFVQPDDLIETVCWRFRASGLSCSRYLLRVSVCLCSLLLTITAAGAQVAPTSRPAPRPNILFITADDMSFDSLGCTGCSLPDISPNLDQLAREGLVIEHCHVATPVCGPSRAALITGTWPQHNGTMGHYNQPPKWFGPSPITTTLPELLRSQAGYYTGVICKNPTAIGWDYQATHLDTGLGRDPSKFHDLTKKFIAAALAQHKPFFLHANSMDPHEFWAGQKYETRAWIDAMMGGSSYQAYPNGKPYPDPQVTYTKEQIPVPPCWPDIPEIRQDIYTYYSSVHRLDETVGAILRALKESGQGQNTLIVFISDHGIGREFAKWSLYPLGTRTPMIVRWPGVVKPASRDGASVISTIDLAPTFLEVAGIPIPSFMDGKSILNILRDEQPRDPREKRELTFSCWNYMNNYPEQDAKYPTYTRDLFDKFDNYRPSRAVHSARYTYIWNAWSDGKRQIPKEMSSGQSIRRILAATGHKARADFEAHRTREEFYDTVKDPGCLVNLIDDPAMKSQIARFHAELLRIMRQTKDQETANYQAAISEAK